MKFIPKKIDDKELSPEDKIFFACMISEAYHNLRITSASTLVANETEQSKATQKVNALLPYFNMFQGKFFQ